MFDWRTKSDTEIVKFLESQQSRLEGIRKPYEPLFDIMTKLFLPRTYDVGQSRRPGEQFGISIYNSTPASCVRKFGVGFSSATVSRDEGEEEWLNFRPLRQLALQIDSIKKYMQEAAEQVRFGFNRSTFYSQTAFLQQVQDASVLWGVLIAQRDLARDRIVFGRMDPRTHWFGLDMYGDIDIDHFKLKMTAKQIIEQFPPERVPENIQKAITDAQRDPQKQYDVLWCIYKNGSVRYGSPHHTDKPFMQFYVLTAGTESQAERLLAFEGVDWRPSVLRIGERTESGYPLTMAADALTAATYGNTMGKHGMIASHRMVQPPKKISRSLREQVQANRLNPDSNTYVDTAEEVIEYLTQKIDPRYIEEMLNRHDNVVEDIFYINFFEMLARMREGTPPTATHIRELLGEKIGQLTPVIQSVEDDSLEPNVDVIWRYETEAGRMPEPPAELFDEAANGKVAIINRYTGQIVQLRRVLRQNQGMVEAIALMKEFRELFPTSLVIVKAKALLEKILTDRVGQDVIFDEAEIAEIEAELAQAAQRAEQMEMAERMAKIVPNVTRDAVDPQSPAALLAGAA